MKLTAEEARNITNTSGWTELLRATATIFTRAADGESTALVSTHHPDSLSTSLTDLGYSVEVRGNVLVVKW